MEPVIVWPEAFVIVKYGEPFCTWTELIVPWIVELLLLDEAVPVLTVATFPINEAPCITAKVLWNDWNEDVSCCWYCSSDIWASWVID